MSATRLRTGQCLDCLLDFARVDPLDLVPVEEVAHRAAMLGQDETVYIQAEPVPDRAPVADPHAVRLIPAGVALDARRHEAAIDPRISRDIADPGLHRSHVGIVHGASHLACPVEGCAQDRQYDRRCSGMPPAARGLTRPAIVISSIRIEPVRMPPRRSTSLPTSTMRRYMSLRLPAIVTSCTGIRDARRSRPRSPRRRANSRRSRR